MQTLENLELKLDEIQMKKEQFFEDYFKQELFEKEEIIT